MPDDTISIERGAEALDRSIARAGRPDDPTPHYAAISATEGDLDGSAWPEAMDQAALEGIAGDYVRMIEPNTEADPAAILVQFLVAFGAVVGRFPYFLVEGDKHYPNLYTVLVGASSKARKGTSWGRIRSTFERIPEYWKPPGKGLSSGEGLIYHVRDAREETKQNKSGVTTTETVDIGVTDKRLLVVEPEFASVLKQAQRAGNILSTTIRDGWDSGCLATMTKNDPNSATNAHICIIGHITSDELRAELTGTDSANGFANRFLFVATKRSKLLPRGGGQPDENEMRTLVDRLCDRIERARCRTRIDMTPQAWTMWDKVYTQLSEGHGGLHGAVTARAEAQVIRLALVYCLLEGTDVIEVSHLLAALAVWQYCDVTAKHIFGASLGDRIADEILRKLQQAGDGGLTRTGIRDAFGRHRSAEQVGAALELLRRKTRATCKTVSTGGRPTEVWVAK
jgi:hypothetical protein